MQSKYAYPIRKFLKKVSPPWQAGTDILLGVGLGKQMAALGEEKTRLRLYIASRRP